MKFIDYCTQRGDKVFEVDADLIFYIGNKHLPERLRQCLKDRGFLADPFITITLITLHQYYSPTSFWRPFFGTHITLTLDYKLTI